MAEQVTGIDLIAEERARQELVEGFGPEHDDEHVDDALARAGACYACPDRFREKLNQSPRGVWPFMLKWWKPTPDDRVRELTKAGALIAAEIDRLLRKQAR